MPNESPDLPPATPLDVRQGLTDPKDVAHPLRWGVLGGGNISRQWVLSSQPCPGTQVSAVATREKNRSEEFAKQLGIPHVFDNYEAMVQSPDVDIVYIGTITGLHYEHTLLALNAGKHVLCEKPLAANLEQAEAMHQAAEEKGVFLLDGMWTRFFPAVEHARYAIESGLIGEVVLVQADFFDPIYTIQAGPLAFGADSYPTAVAVAGQRSSAAVVEYGPSKCAVFTFPPFNAELGEGTQFVGEKGRIVLGRPGHCPTDITIYTPPPNGVPSQYRTRNRPSPAHEYVYPLPENVSIPAAFPNQHGFLYQTEAVHRCIAAGLRECPQYTKADSLHSMHVLTEINKARAAKAS